jgi:hypothetical protein
VVAPASTGGFVPVGRLKKPPGEITSE